MYSFFLNEKPLTHGYGTLIELNIEQRIEFRIQTEISQLFSYAVVVIGDTAPSKIIKLF